ncbi:DUF4864 domain-containing protein [Mesorhizobium sp. BR1-1-16]|uniref:DUF4864 domain-containing protein n=1 Tax=Mesorhizobium sp. BR1-1-16 TaxID=2876653 RepID=UPI001CCF02A6|nr:DUF4864 domain-containing protein [Mesorhizobium sp. BR1-1-16]MBZ9935492.1 DUF4864 domain-containing protein [Mesorhizobium sp. BR1-1-16]
MKPAAVLTAFLIAALPLAALAEPSSADKDAFKSLVQGQLQAFRKDDAATAYGKAAPGIQRMFPSPDLFMTMVRQAYPPVYRSSSVAFGEVADGPAGPMEKVYLTAADGTNWIALYTFEKQADGSWKISGCQLVKDNAPTI